MHKQHQSILVSLIFPFLLILIPSPTKKNQYNTPSANIKYPPSACSHEPSSSSSSLLHSASSRSTNKKFTKSLLKNSLEFSSMHPSNGGQSSSYANRMPSANVTSRINSMNHTVPWEVPSTVSTPHSRVNANNTVGNYQQNYNSTFARSRPLIMPGLSAIGSVFGNGVRNHMADAMTGGLRPVKHELDYSYLTSLSPNYVNEDGNHPHIFDMLHDMNCVASEMTRTGDTDNLMYENINRCHEESHHQESQNHQSVDIDSSHFRNNVKYPNSNIRSNGFMRESSAQSYGSPNFPSHRKYQFSNN